MKLLFWQTRGFTRVESRNTAVRVYGVYVTSRDTRRRRVCCGGLGPVHVLTACVWTPGHASRHSMNMNVR